MALSLVARGCWGGGGVRRNGPVVLTGRTARHSFGRPNRLAHAAAELNHQNLTDRAEPPPGVPPVHSVQPLVADASDAHHWDFGSDGAFPLWAFGLFPLPYACSDVLCTCYLFVSNPCSCLGLPVTLHVKRSRATLVCHSSGCSDEGQGGAAHHSVLRG